MSRVVRIYQAGAPSVMRLEQQTVGAPGPGQVRLHQAAIGLNFVDTLFRSGAFGAGGFPFVPGVEGAGVVDEVGPAVTNVQVGDRVAYYSALGAYADERLIESHHLVHVPDDITLEQAAALLAKGLTAWMLVKRAHAVAPGDFVLVQAAAGGVGTFVSRWAKGLGATVIAVVGSPTKAEFVRRGAIEHVLVNDESNPLESIRALTDGRGVDVVYDGVGTGTFALSVAAVRDGGDLIRFGNSSRGGPPSSGEERRLAGRGIVALSPSVAQYITNRTQLDQASAEVFAAFRAGTFGTLAITRYALADVTKAHQDLEARRTTGPLILIPWQRD